MEATESMNTNTVINPGEAVANGTHVSAKTVGMATIANDKVFDWVLPFLESWYQTNRDTKLYVIPYDENCERTREACKLYGAEFVEPDDTALDDLAKRLYPFYPNYRRRLRKFLSLLLPLDEVMYLDVDVVLVRDMSCFFGLLEPGKTEFIVGCPAVDYVYNPRAKKIPYLKDAMLFNDGFFVTSNKILSLDHFYEVIDRDEETFHKVRHRYMLFAQPLTNFVTHNRGVKLRCMYELVDRASGESFYKAKGVTFDATGRPLDVDGKEIYFVHWAGATRLPAKRVFDPGWLKFSADAAARMAKA